MEETTTYVVQFWVDGYEYWTNCSEPTENMFALPKAWYATAEEARARYEVLAAASPSAKYRVAKVMTTVEVI